MENKNEEAKIRMPNESILWFEKPVTSYIIKTKMLQYNIPFLLCTTGPGPSLILTHSAPKERVIPISICPSREKTNVGIAISSVTRTPSARYWLNKKYRICWVLCITSFQIANMPNKCFQAKEYFFQIFL
jgi:hypothetical protein